jgi:mono/diheme cytochrome c family protein
MKTQLLIAALLLAGCRGQTSRESPVFGIRNMYDQPKYDVQEESSFFPDHRTMRPLVEGVVAHDEVIDPQIAMGRLDDESGYVLEIPQPVVQKFGGMAGLLERGQQRYGIYCVPCHDSTGNGNGLVKRRAVAAGAAAFVPPTFHQDRIRRMPDGQLFATISNGKGNMPPYGPQTAVEDRWAIVGYVRALQVANPKPVMQAPLAPTAIPGATSQPAPGGSAVHPLPGGSAVRTPPAASSGPPATKPTGAQSAKPAGSVIKPAGGTSAKPSGAAKPETKDSTEEKKP